MNYRKGFAPLLVIIIVALLASGVYAYTRQNSSPTRSTDSETGVAEDWNAYADDVIGIRFRYPKGWDAPRIINGNYNDVPYTITLGIFNISVSTTTNKVTPLPNTIYDNSEEVREENVLIGGRNGIKRSFPDEPEMFVGTQSILIPLSDRVITINYADNGPEMNQVYEQIIQTMVFADRTTSTAQTSNPQTADWKNYLNTGGKSCVRIRTKDFGDIYISNSNVSGEGLYAISYPSDAKIEVLNPNSFEAQTCGSPTGFGLDDVASNDTVTIGGKQYVASGFRYLDNSNSFMSLRTSFRDKIHVVYGVAHYDENFKNLGPLTDSEYQTALNSVKAIVSTLR